MRYDWQLEDLDYLGKSKSSDKKTASRTSEKGSPGHFRTALLLAYRLEYGAVDQKSIAAIIDQHVGRMTPGRLSQILSDREKLKHETVRKILIPIKSEDNRRDVLLAYLRDVFSIRTDHVISEDVFGGSITPDKVAALNELFALGRYQRVMWAAYVGSQQDPVPSLKYRLFHLGVRSAFRLDRPGSGLGFVRNWINDARLREEREVLATCEYHRTNLLFVSGAAPVQKCLAINANALALLKSLPSGFESAYRGIIVDPWQLEAQRIGMYVAEAERNASFAGEAMLDKLLVECQTLLDSSSSEPKERMSKGLLARIEFLIGHHFRALDDLDEVKIQTIKAAEYRHDDWMLARARSLRMTQSTEAAEEFVVEALAQIRFKENRYHYRMLDLELALLRNQEIEESL